MCMMRLGPTSFAMDDKELSGRCNGERFQNSLLAEECGAVFVFTRIARPKPKGLGEIPKHRSIALDDAKTLATIKMIAMAYPSEEVGSGSWTCELLCFVATGVDCGFSQKTGMIRSTRLWDS